MLKDDPWRNNTIIDNKPANNFLTLVPRTTRSHST